MINKFLSDIQWKYFVLSIVLGTLILLVLGILIGSIKSDAFAFLFNNGLFPLNKITPLETISSQLPNTLAWIPIQLFAMVTSQVVSCWYLVKHSNGVELTNGIAHGIIVSLLTFLVVPLYSFLALIISIAVSYKIKPKKQAKIIHLRPKR